ncbi:hypothetical protein EPO04_02725 [Patescibacteria group bacterium]|nr:MAG: hypothetical protein EPO04_02725 [Patescibacteria group bacterium]
MPSPFMADMGTGPVYGADEDNAATNIKTLIADCGLEGASCVRDASGDCDGRFTFVIYRPDAGLCAVVDMPGLQLEKVRRMGDDNVVGFPRLYVNGGSWIWMYAVDIIKMSLEPTEDD